MKTSVTIKISREIIKSKRQKIIEKNRRSGDHQNFKSSNVGIWNFRKIIMGRKIFKEELAEYFSNLGKDKMYRLKKSRGSQEE